MDKMRNVAAIVGSLRKDSIPLATAGASGMRKKNEEPSRSTRSCICLAAVFCTTAILVLETPLAASRLTW